MTYPAAPVAPPPRSRIVEDDDVGAYDIALPPPEDFPAATQPPPVVPLTPQVSSAVSKTAVNQVLINRLGALPRKSEAKRALENLKEQREAQLDEMHRASPIRDVYVPIGLIVVGIALSYYHVRYVADERVYGLGAAVLAIVPRLVLASGLMFGAMFFACTVLEVNFLSTFRRSLLRFAAIAVAPAAIYAICAHDGSAGGAALGVMISLAAYFTLFKGLMKTDMRDTGVCVTITWIFVAAAQYAADKAESIISGSPF